MERIWILTSWKWWRHNHGMPFWKAVRWTFMTDVWDKIDNFYCGIWLQTRGRYLHWKVEKEKAEMWKRIKEKKL